MARVRKIPRNPSDRLFYLIDANFLVARYIPAGKVSRAAERTRIERSQAWWVRIQSQLANGKATVYIPDICIAEAFKVLAKKYYKDRYFTYPVEYKNARDRLARDIHTSPKTLKATKRHIKFHDISTSRDIIISMDRFYEVFLKLDLSVSVPDLIILATAKHLIDFFDIPPRRLHIVTLDEALWRGSKHFRDIPAAFNPNAPSGFADRVFSDAA